MIKDFEFTDYELNNPDAMLTCYSKQLGRAYRSIETAIELVGDAPRSIDVNQVLISSLIACLDTCNEELIKVISKIK